MAQKGGAYILGQDALSVIGDPPPLRISTVACFAPASTAFSTSSLATEPGRSTTSPAAMRLAIWGGI